MGADCSTCNCQNEPNNEVQMHRVDKRLLKSYRLGRWIDNESTNEQN